MPEGFLLALIYSIIQEFPVYGIGQVWSHLKFTLGIRVNKKRVERLMRRERWTLKKERKGGRLQARRAISRWIEWYNTGRPHSALGYASPRQAAERHRQSQAAA